MFELAMASPTTFLECMRGANSGPTMPFLDLVHALTSSSFLQSMVVQLVFNLLKSRNTIAVPQQSIAFDAFPLQHSRIFLDV